jgi:hypothetical protein
LKRSKTSLLAWTLFAIITAFALFWIAPRLGNRMAGDSLYNVVGSLLWLLLGLEYAFLATLIISRQPRNVIGWLMMGPVTMLLLDSIAIDYLEQFPTAPAVATAPMVLALSFNSVSPLLLLIFPLLFTMLFFPDGRLPSPRWRWIPVFGLGMGAIIIFTVLFSQTLSYVDKNGWVVANPIGFLPAGIELPETLIIVALALFTLSCLAAPFVRYRRASGVQRNQIKWLFYACGLFVLVFALTIITPEDAEATILLDFLNLLFVLAVMAIPAAIAIAILRYRLYDIDVIIRKTLLYGALTGLLALIYFGSVVLLQGLFEAITGQSSPIIIVISTLLIAALFAPLRRRLQRAIDRRFFRQKYNAQRVSPPPAASHRPPLLPPEIRRPTGAGPIRRDSPRRSRVGSLNGRIAARDPRNRAAGKRHHLAAGRPFMMIIPTEYTRLNWPAWLVLPLASGFVVALPVTAFYGASPFLARIHVESQ